jgi:tetratricopeptide (TPR) repeat protein
MYRGLKVGRRRLAFLAAAVAVPLWQGCAGHAATTQGARTALDVGAPSEALKLINEQLEVKDEREPLKDIEGEKVLYVLDRSTILQQLDLYAISSKDLEVADKQIEVLDFSRNAIDDIGKYMFSDATGAYKAPAYEKLMINTLNMLNYLVRGDLNGARVEARRFAVMQKFVADHDDQSASLAGPGSYLAGFTFEKSGKPDEALRYYEEALKSIPYQSLQGTIRALASRSSVRSERIARVIGQTENKASASPPEGDEKTADILIVVNYGRVPAKIARRIPIGLALTLVSGDISPDDHARASYLAGQGLVTWVNYPELGEPVGEYGYPTVSVDNTVAVQLDEAFAVDIEARKAWDKGKTALILSAITRMISRAAVGEGTRRVAGGGLLGALLSLGAQATLTAVDTPDTRSWSTLPARIAIGRVRVPAGEHELRLSVRGMNKTRRVRVDPGGWAVVSLTALR